ncbi:MarR family transcriptional regulator [Cytophagaceae bacterium DM2B3-1]|uniref:MarR family transcriptional regulator n=1 Tax=Xanthocytophaga flava TaxID=3048013 RepID=A0ABT7CQF6_9BACT|nr:MarR family transcriptional regulator [Xanthocytophaga flavus]MDJ1468077.1 MarR family transcriptional regulator [Xanthocytophaga flavus]MDJ1495973.1 MarR family transcriptional regulator [Xanthocytophaga flavus]
MKREETVDYQIKACWHAISRMYNGEAAQHDFTMAIGHVLLTIDAEKGTPATHIGPLVGLESRSLTRMLRTLEEDGLIYRETNARDKRFVNVFLTESGKEKREIARRTVREFNFMIRNNVPSEKLDIFFDVVQQITKLVEQRRTLQSSALMETDLPE